MRLNNIRNHRWLLLLAIALGFGVSTQIYKEYDSYKKSDNNNPSQVSALDLERRIHSGEVLEKFNALPQVEQKNVLDYMDRFVLEKTDIGKTINDIIKNVRIEEVEEHSLSSSGNYLYRTGSNKFFYCREPLDVQFSYYFGGTPVLFKKAHELLHAHQDRNSKWDAFESFMSGLEKLKEKGPNGPTEAEYFFPLQKIREFSSRILGNPDLPYEVVLREIQKISKEYMEAKAAFTVIREVNAYLTFSNFTSEDIRKRLVKSGNYPYLEIIGRKQFERIVYLTVELLGLLDPIEAAAYAGRNGDSLEQYEKSITSLKKMSGIENPFLEGSNRQDKLRRELEDVAREAARYTLERYGSFVGGG